MHLEIRKKGGKRKCYLAHSYRKDGKVKKLRIYLGADLPPAELEAKKRAAEARMKARLGAARRISDPFETVLSPKELVELSALEAKAHIKITHLTDDEWRKFTEAFTYDTNAIEGSSLESKEVDEILGKDKWPDKPKEDISETYGVAKAIDCIRGTKEHLSVSLVLELHRIVFENSKPFAGKLRAAGVEVVVMDQHRNVVHRGAPSSEVRELLLELARWYGKNRKKYSPIVLAAVVHNQFENIHPFQDGNGRVGRLLLNNILLKHGMPPLNIELRNRHEYYSALQAYEKEHNLRPFIELMLKEYRNLRKMLRRR
ncbi:MAG: Fic family protein [Candidatus Micrarchaeia archaeon]|jgi:Fic family protein